jgi:hypothetical protein
VVDQRLGSNGSRRFWTAQNGLDWLRPVQEPFDSWPAESWQDKAITQRLYLDDLVACCDGFPANLLTRYPNLRWPAKTQGQESSAAPRRMRPWGKFPARTVRCGPSAPARLVSHYSLLDLR